MARPEVPGIQVAPVNAPKRAETLWCVDEVLAQLEAVRELVESGVVEASPEERGWLRGVCDALRVAGEAVSLS